MALVVKEAAAWGRLDVCRPVMPLPLDLAWFHNPAGLHFFAVTSKKLDKLRINKLVICIREYLR